MRGHFKYRIRIYDSDGNLVRVRPTDAWPVALLYGWLERRRFLDSGRRMDEIAAKEELDEYPRKVSRFG